jgi:hypothetical protein
VIALNRKNALFAGSDGGDDHWATIATLIETCKLNDIDPLSCQLSHGCPRQDRQRSSQSRYRRAIAVGLPKARPQSRGLRTSLTERHTALQTLLRLGRTGICESYGAELFQRDNAFIGPGGRRRQQAKQNRNDRYGAHDRSPLRTDSQVLA